MIIERSGFACVILAAGEGTRMKSRFPKVLHEVSGKAMLGHVLAAVEALGIKSIVVVAGHGIEQVKAFVGKRAQVAEQAERRGSAHALGCAEESLKNFSGKILVLSGDTPLLRKATLSKLLTAFEQSGKAAAFLTAVHEDATGYGRVVRRDDGSFEKIVEEVQASASEKKIKEMNAGAYGFEVKILFEVLKKLKPDPKKGEIFLPEALNVLAVDRQVITVEAADVADTFGVNSRKDLALAERINQDRIAEHWMKEGVTLKDPKTITIDENVTIGPDTVIYPFTVIEGPTKIGARCLIGPFAHIRKDVEIADEVTIGNFVEVVRSRVGKKTVIKHLSYVGDGQIGEEVNVGCGTITANYDGSQKHQTVIEEKAQIGSGTILIAPVRIGKGSKTGAGAVVTKGKNVPKGKTVVGIPAKEK
jgi:bifunctional UDP-N-acetylglucosamine pyrophosphorylase / glucosamine-1-phosphate N-acetyltransferase